MGAADPEPVGDVTACDATPYVDASPVEFDSLKIGEASMAIDPISSAGVQIAIQSAMAGSAVVHTLHTDPSAINLARAFWSREIATRSTRHAAWVAQFYGQAASRFATPFWRQRSLSAPGFQGLSSRERPLPLARDLLPPPDEVLRLSESLKITLAPCLVEDRIVARPVVSHPSLRDPIAFVHGVDVSALLDAISPGMTVAAILQVWSTTIEPARAIGILSWMWRSGLVRRLEQQLHPRDEFAPGRG
jgi:hypothetical protein